MDGDPRVLVLVVSALSRDHVRRFFLDFLAARRMDGDPRVLVLDVAILHHGGPVPEVDGAVDPTIAVQLTQRVHRLEESQITSGSTRAGVGRRRRAPIQIAERRLGRMQAKGVESEAAADVHRSASAADTRGRHRISAELKRLDQESRFLQEELGELEKTEKVSAALEELLQEVESIPDRGLLPMTIGRGSTSWDRWFEGPQDFHARKCWIM